MKLHPSAFEYRRQSDQQVAKIEAVYKAAREFADFLSETLPDGPDKAYVLRSLRTTAMWANVAITRQPDGAPRD